MAEITDTDIPEQVVPAHFVRQAIRVKLNGPGGNFPSATLNAGNIISVAFKKNGGAWNALNDTYLVKYNASSGKRLIAYMVLRFEEEPIEG